MRDGVLRGMRALLAENGPPGRQRRAAHRGRDQRNSPKWFIRPAISVRTTRQNPPLWQIRAPNRCPGSRAQEDRVPGAPARRSTVLRSLIFLISGMPIPRSSVPADKRSPRSGIPNISVPSSTLPLYSWVIDDQQDLVISPWLTTKDGPRLELDYRIHLNEGQPDGRYLGRRNPGYAAGPYLRQGSVRLRRYLALRL